MMDPMYDSAGKHDQDLSAQQPFHKFEGYASGGAPTTSQANRMSGVMPVDDSMQGKFKVNTKS